ncbi:hypothetical protein CBL_10850 [Carabus blaptoides fortunei]
MKFGACWPTGIHHFSATHLYNKDLSGWMTVSLFDSSHQSHFVRPKLTTLLNLKSPDTVTKKSGCRAGGELQMRVTPGPSPQAALCQMRCRTLITGSTPNGAFQFKINALYVDITRKAPSD